MDSFFCFQLVNLKILSQLFSPFFLSFFWFYYPFMFTYISSSCEICKSEFFSFLFTCEILLLIATSALYFSILTLVSPLNLIFAQLSENRQTLIMEPQTIDFTLEVYCWRFPLWAFLFCSFSHPKRERREKEKKAIEDWCFQQISGRLRELVQSWRVESLQSNQ